MRCLQRRQTDGVLSFLGATSGSKKVLPPRSRLLNPTRLPPVPRRPPNQRRAPAICPRELARISPLVAGSAGFLDELVDQGLTDPVRDVLVDRLHRLAHCGILLRR